MRRNKLMPNMKSLLMRVLRVLPAIAVMFLLSAVVIDASSYPSKPVRFIVTMAAGGSTDTVARFIAAKLTERLGNQVIVENRLGAGGIIATETVAKADPDGYTFLFTAASFTMEPALQKLPYNPVKSFIPVAKLASNPSLLTVHPNVPAKSVQELIALAKQKPGQLIFVATGVGATPHMGTELLKMMTGIQIKIVQFKGGSQAVTDLLGGHSHATMVGLTPVMPHIKSGKLRVLATCGLERSVFLPDVPTIAESGVPGYELSQWFGLLAPVGTPAPVIDRLNKELKAILTSDDIKKLLLTQGAEADYLGPAEFGPFLEREMTKWVDVVKKAKIKVQ